MKNRIITISRQFGSGGRTIGRQTAARLDIPCYDQELIEKLSEKSGFTPEYLKERSEYTQRGGWLANALSTRAGGGMTNQDQIWIAQRELILELAEKSPCVIVGRCADYILRGEADCLNVFIHASLEKRAERIVKLYGETGVEPEKRLRDKDKRRQAYYQFYTDTRWGEAVNYHIALDSGALGIERCVDLIAQLY